MSSQKAKVLYYMERDRYYRDRGEIPPMLKTYTYSNRKMEQRVKKAHQLRKGDLFSYVGSFKVYEALESPIICSDFASGIYLERPRAKIHATDGGLRKFIVIRLLAYQKCVIHERFGRCNANGNIREDEAY